MIRSARQIAEEILHANHVWEKAKADYKTVLFIVERIIRQAQLEVIEEAINIVESWADYQGVTDEAQLCYAIKELAKKIEGPAK